MSAVSDLWQELRERAARTGDAQRRMWQAYFDATTGVATGKVGPADAVGAYWEVARSASELYVRELSSLGVAYVRAVADLNNSVAERVASGLARASGREDPPAAPRRVHIPMAGPLDGVASATFTVANPQPGIAHISFTVSELSRSGGAPFDPGITFAPETLTLQPGEESNVTVTVPLPAERFQCGDTYAATVSVHGSDPLELRLSVTVNQA